MRSLIFSFGKIKQSIISAYVKQIIDGVNFIHSRDLTHGNLNCGNIMIGNHSLLVLSDYGNLNQMLETLAHKITVTEDEFSPNSFYQTDD